MLQQVSRLEEILLEEQGLYQQVLELEEEKTSVIQARDGKNLDRISLQQDNLLKRLDGLDAHRQEIIEEYVRVNRIADVKSHVTLQEVVRSMDEDSAGHLLRIGMDLKKTLLSLDRIQNSNQQMLDDNMKFFDMLVSGLRQEGSMGTGYSSRGQEVETASSPIIINQTA